ncbi:hypothetical protein QC761_207614 [Podospora bellae-mahoneyi]|uniref:Uncharacterized protein n=1 Tax=Podospora bellae-mahoneyi TaxID=2093777 RepID=A0ABR0FR09_9PEZI|nr:hypothetical protein QC761_207614 [Podospora bellae-mahoneyi]
MVLLPPNIRFRPTVLQPEFAEPTDINIGQIWFVTTSRRPTLILNALLHLLRIAPEWMKETQEGLQDFYRIFGIHLLRGWHESTSETAKFDRIVEENWDRVMAQFDSLQAKLKRRIEVKADEIRGLQDGAVYSMSLIQETKTCPTSSGLMSDPGL